MIKQNSAFKNSKEGNVNVCIFTVFIYYGIVPNTNQSCFGLKGALIWPLRYVAKRGRLRTHSYSQLWPGLLMQKGREDQANMKKKSYLMTHFNFIFSKTMVPKVSQPKPYLLLWWWHWVKLVLIDMTVCSRTVMSWCCVYHQVKKTLKHLCSVHTGLTGRKWGSFSDTHRLLVQIKEGSKQTSNSHKITSCDIKWIYSFP